MNTINKLKFIMKQQRSIEHICDAFNKTIGSIAKAQDLDTNYNTLAYMWNDMLIFDAFLVSIVNLDPDETTVIELRYKEIDIEASIDCIFNNLKRHTSEIYGLVYDAPFQPVFVVDKNYNIAVILKRHLIHNNKFIVNNIKDCETSQREDDINMYLKSYYTIDDFVNRLMTNI